MTARPAQRHRTKIAAPLLIAGLTLSAGATCGLPLGGCGGPPAGVAPATLDPLPDHIVQRLTDCGKRGPTPLAPVQHTVAFDVFMNPDGEVQEVALRDTTLHFDEVEACMQSALGGLSGRVADGPLRRREPTSPAPPEPETRTLLASPVVIAVGVAEVAIVVGVMVLTQSRPERRPQNHRPNATCSPQASGATQAQTEVRGRFSQNRQLLLH